MFVIQKMIFAAAFGNENWSTAKVETEYDLPPPTTHTTVCTLSCDLCVHKTYASVGKKLRNLF
jgi:hypothetical protein